MLCISNFFSRCDLEIGIVLLSHDGNSLGEDVMDATFGKPTHAQHVYLPYYEGQMLLTSKVSGDECGACSCYTATDTVDTLCRLLPYFINAHVHAI